MREPKVSIGSADNYVMLAKSGISTVPTSDITGNIGVSPIAATAMTGFSLTLDSSGEFSTSSQLTGQAFAADNTAPTPALLTVAVNDMEAAYTNAANRVNQDANRKNLNGGILGGAFGGISAPLTPGVYTFVSAVTIASTIYFQGSGQAPGQGDTDVFIIQITGVLAQAANVEVILTNGALAKNIFWQVSGNATVGAGAHMEGILLVKTDVLFIIGSSLSGHILAQTACNLQMATITNAPTASPASPASAPTASPTTRAPTASPTTVSLTSAPTASPTVVVAVSVKAQVKGTITLDAVNLSDLANATFKNTFEITLKTTIAAAAASVSPENVTINGYTAANPASRKRLQRRLVQASELSVDFVVEFPPVMTTTAELAAMNSTDESSTSITPATNFARSLNKNELSTDMFARGMAAYGNVTLANVEVEQLEIVYFYPPPPPPLPPLLPPPFLPPPPPPRDNPDNKGTSDGAPILALVGGGIGAAVILLGGVAMVIHSKRRQASTTSSGNKALALPACHKTKIVPFADEEL